MDATELLFYFYICRLNVIDNYLIMIPSAYIRLVSENPLEVLQGILDVAQKGTAELNEGIMDMATESFSPLARVGMVAYAKGLSCEAEGVIDVVRSDELRRSALLARVEAYTRRDYLPLVDFPAQRAYDDEKAEAMSVYENVAIRMFDIPNNVASCVRYVMDEIIDNITEHSGAKRGYVCIAGDRDSGVLDVCIADNGKTVLGSYEALQGNEISSDLEAMQAANRGISTKNLPNAENRGYGITTSRNMLVNGLGGTFLMISGEAVHVSSPSVRRFVQLPEGYGICGTMVSIRIPYRNESFSYINYVE